MIEVGFFHVHGKSTECNRGDFTCGPGESGHATQSPPATPRQAQPTSRCLPPC